MYYSGKKGPPYNTQDRLTAIIVKFIESDYHNDHFSHLRALVLSRRKTASTPQKAPKKERRTCLRSLEKK